MNKKKETFLLILTSKYYRKFISYFVIFGIVTSVIVTEINYKYKQAEMSKELQTDSRERAAFIQKQFREFILISENNLLSINQSKVFHLYLENKNLNNKKDLMDLFISISLASPAINHLQFFNQYGNEEILIDHLPGKPPEITPFFPSEHTDDTEYFNETKSLSSGDFWHSKINLNMENGKLENPHQPVIRIGTPVFFKGKFQGALIANMYVKNLFNDFTSFENYLLYLVDKDGEFLIHPKTEYSWSRYLGHDQKLSDEFPENYRKILSDKFFSANFIYSYSLEDPVQNKEGLKLILAAKPSILKKARNNLIKSALRLMAIIIILSFPLSLLTAIIPSHMQTKLHNLVEELQRISETDGLTGIFNRMKTEEILNYEMERSKRFLSNLGIIMVDIDYFKKVNDNHGHNAGDKTLKAFAQIIRSTLRKSDTIGRWGGEEFLIVCPETGLENLKEVAEKLRTKVADYKFPAIEKMTISQGIAVLSPEDNIEEFIKRADTALYKAKDSGRNRVGVNT